MQVRGLQRMHALHAQRMQTPPASLILLSASLVKYLALTISGCSGRWPLPSTFMYPAFTTSITGALSVLSFHARRTRSGTSDHSFSTLMAGLHDVDHRCLVGLVLPREADALRDKRPQLLHIDGRPSRRRSPVPCRSCPSTRGGRAPGQA